MVETTIIGIDVAKRIFQITVCRRMARLRLSGSFAAPRFSDSLAGWRVVLLALKHAAVRTSGHVRSVPSAMMSD